MLSFEHHYPLKNFVIFFKMQFHFSIKLPLTIICLYETGPISEYSVSTVDIALALGLQFLQCWGPTHVFPVVYGFNTLRPRQNGRLFADDTFKCIFFNENIRIAIKISQKFVPKGQINNIPSLV